MVRNITLLMVAIFVAGVTGAGERPTATVYKSPTCGCCGYYVEYLREAGFPVEVVDTTDLASIKRQHGVPENLASCHTTVVDGYVVEGHVPLTALDRLLAERPPVTGVALRGMPTGSPGMPGAKKAPFRIFQFKAGDPEVELYTVE
ncbi:MAG: hypothetical protein OES38_05215 [Gammaproteobacteria bacterium]|nr:hypothetical protein [Gammaproteobacteria bacterium]